MSPPQKIIVGVIGAGANTRRRHLPEILSKSGVEVKAVANRSEASAVAVSEKFGIAVATDDWRKIIDDPEINAVIIGTWPNMHAQLTIAALEAGKHVMCEARMSMNAKEAHSMLAASKRHPNLVAQIVPSPFTLSYDVAIQAIIRSGDLGPLTAISVKGVTGAFPDPPGSPLSWRQDRAKSGCNVMSMGILYEGLTRWVGPATRVMAMAKTVVKLRVDPETSAPVGVTVPDHLNVLAEMACGAQAHMEFSAVCGARPGPQHEFWVHGEKGTLHLDVDSGVLKLALKDQGGELKCVNGSPRGRGWRVEEEFLNAIRGLENIRLTDFETAVGYMEFTEAVARSVQSGQAVALPLLS